MKYFNKFNHLADSLGIQVKYLITPKSEQYFLAMKEKKYDLIWLEIKNNLKDKIDMIWDYEEMNVDTFKFYWFWDETHSSVDAANAFTKIIKNRLKEN